MCVARPAFPGPTIIQRYTAVYAVRATGFRGIPSPTPDPPYCTEYRDESSGFDHGAGHSLLLLYDAKTPRSENINDFNTLGCYPSIVSISLF